MVTWIPLQVLPFLLKVKKEGDYQEIIQVKKQLEKDPSLLERIKNMVKESDKERGR